MFVPSAGHGALRTAKRAGPYAVEFLNQSKEGAKEILATSKHLVGYEVGTVGPRVEKLIVKGETAGSRGFESVGAKEPSRPSKMQQEVEKGQAPKEVIGVHKGHIEGQEPHIHYKDGTSST